MRGSSDEVDLEPAEHAGGAADVIALRMGEDERRQPSDAEAGELSGDVRLGRPLVDEHVALGDLQQDRIALADVERRDAEARRRWRRRRARPQQPNGRTRSRARAEPSATARGARGRRSRGQHEQASSASADSAANATSDVASAPGSPPTSRAQAAT